MLLYSSLLEKIITLLEKLSNFNMILNLNIFRSDEAYILGEHILFL